MTGPGLVVVEKIFHRRRRRRRHHLRVDHNKLRCALKIKNIVTFFKGVFSEKQQPDARFCHTLIWEAFQRFPTEKAITRLS